MIEVHLNPLRLFLLKLIPFLLNLLKLLLSEEIKFFNYFSDRIPFTGRKKKGYCKGLDLFFLVSTLMGHKQRFIIKQIVRTCHTTEQRTELTYVMTTKIKVPIYSRSRSAPIPKGSNSSARQTHGQTDGCHQIYYLPASKVIKTGQRPLPTGSLQLSLIDCISIRCNYRKCQPGFSVLVFFRNNLFHQSSILGLKGLTAVHHFLSLSPSVHKRA